MQCATKSSNNSDSNSDSITKKNNFDSRYKNDTALEAQTRAKLKASAERKDSLLAAWKSRYRYEYDEFNKLKFYTPNQAPYYINVNFIYPYIAITSSGQISIRTKFLYSSKRWLFIRQVKILYGTNPVDYNFKFKEDNNSDGIWEYADVNEDEYPISDLELLSGKNTKIRYDGSQYYDDRVITNLEKQIIKKVLYDYHLYKGDNLPEN